MTFVGVDGSTPWTRTVVRALPWLALAALWMAVANYRGLYHDAVLYSFQAIARLRPELYSGDIFLRHGSQDSYSLFPWFQAALVDWLGVGPAAAWMTFGSILMLLVAAGLLARRLSPATPALLGVCFLLALPTDYAPFATFQAVEYFMSPRMPAEALALGAVLAVLGGHRLLAAALLIGSAMIHPLMAVPAVIICVFLGVPAGGRRQIAIISLATIMLLAVAGSLPLFDGYRVDAAWREYFDHLAGYLFAGNWRAADWLRVCPAMLTLLLGARVLEEPRARTTCIVVLFTALLGIAVMWIGADWLRIALVVQGQGYRWLWPVALLSVLLLPAIGLRLWNRGPSGRAALFALAAAWISRGESFAPIVVIVALVLAIQAIRTVQASDHMRWVSTGSAVMLGGTACFSLANAVMSLPHAFEESFAPEIIDRLRTLFAGGALPALAVIAVFVLARAPGKRLAKAAVAVSLLCICLLLAPLSHRIWTRQEFGNSLHAAFAPWRALIEQGSAVLWLESPESNWLLLERPSYFSIQQTVSGVFSRTAALELLARQHALIPYMKAAGLGRELGFVDEDRREQTPAARTLEEVCRAIDARFVVSRAKLGPTLALAPANVPAGYRVLRLYRCELD